MVAQRPGLALAYLQAGDPDSARVHLDFIAREDFALVPRDQLWFGTICLTAEVRESSATPRAPPRSTS